MKLIDFNWQPTDRQLRQFGIICLFALPAIAWLWGAGSSFVATLALVGLVLASIGLASPTFLKPVFLGLTIVATPIGMVIGEVVILAIYFGVFLPFGLVFRLAKRDSMQRTLDKNRKSYWQAKKQATSVASYYRQS